MFSAKVQTKGFFISMEFMDKKDGDTSITLVEGELTYSRNGCMYTFSIWKKKGKYIMIPPQEGMYRGHANGKEPYILRMWDIAPLVLN